MKRGNGIGNKPQRVKDIILAVTDGPRFIGP